MPGYVNGIPHATSNDRIDLWPTTSRNIAQWVDENVPRNDDPRLTNARPPTTHSHEITDVDGLQDALDGKTDTTDPRLSDARPPTAHTHEITDVDGLNTPVARTIPPEHLLNGWRYHSSIPITLRRDGTMCTLVIPSLSLEGVDATASPFYALPLGFRVGSRGNYGAVGWVNFNTTPEIISKNFSSLACAARGRIDGIISWPTDDPWPTTLPGDPA